MFSSFTFRCSVWGPLMIIFAACFMVAGCSDDDPAVSGSISGLITIYGELPETGELSVNLETSDGITTQSINANHTDFTFSGVKMGTYSLYATWTDAAETCTVGAYAGDIVLTKSNRDITGADFEVSFGQIALSKAAAYIRNMQNADGGFPFRIEISADSDFETTTWAARGLIMSGNAAESDMIRSAADYILDAQAEDGHFNEVNTAHTAFALLTLIDADISGSETDAAVTWLKNAQLSDGSWGRGLEEPGLTLYTGVVMTALSAAGVLSSDPVMTDAVGFCETSQNADGGWAMAAGDSWSMTTSWMLRGLLAAGVSESTDMIQNARAFVLSCQNEDGGFGQVPAAPSDPELTAYAMLGLARIIPDSPELKDAAEYLRAVQQEDGTYISATPVEIEEPEKNLQTTSFVIWAIHAVSQSSM